MARPNKEQKRRIDIRVDAVQRRVRMAGGAKKPVDYGITKRGFHQILDKASQPIEKAESDSESA